MAGVMDNRNSPFGLLSVKSATEIHRPPFKRGVVSVLRSGGNFFAMTADFFGLEKPTTRANSRPEAAALAEVLDVLQVHPYRCKARI